MSKIYECLRGEKLKPRPNTVSEVQLSADPWQTMHHHMLGRITTEWGAASVYLWLMAHSTGELQKALAQPLQDEVNHLAKFWGFHRWAFAKSSLDCFKESISRLMKLYFHHRQERSFGGSLLSHLEIPRGWPALISLAFTLTRILVRLQRWDQELSPSFLRHLLGAGDLCRVPAQEA